MPMKTLFMHSMLMPLVEMLEGAWFMLTMAGNVHLYFIPRKHGFTIEIRFVLLLLLRIKKLQSDQDQLAQKKLKK